MRRLVAVAIVVAPLSARADDLGFIALGVGMEVLTRDASSDNLGGGLLELGQAIHPRLRLVESIEGTSGVIDRDMPIVRESHVAATMGLRWIPFAPAAAEPTFSLSPHIDATAIFVEARVGIDVRERSPYGAPDLESSTGLGPVGVAALGYEPVQGRGYGVGVELAEHVSYFTDGYQRGLTVEIVAQLDR
ncbi:MAG TPA: hypothetical protein VGO00_01430 [Kofleriaceae bacterium]|nr:hypothetical protein [Kofleriaceae bacterium]